MANKEINVECPHCRNTLNLRQFKEYKNSVRKAFWANRKGLGQMTIIVIFLILLLITMTWQLAKATNIPSVDDMNITKETLSMILPR